MSEPMHLSWRTRALLAEEVERILRTRAERAEAEVERLSRALALAEVPSYGASALSCERAREEQP